MGRLQFLFVLLWLGFLASGCKTLIKRIHVMGAAELQGDLSSTYKTTYASGDNRPSVGGGYGLGAGIYLPESHSSVSVEGHSLFHKSEEFSVDMDTYGQFVHYDYYLPSEKSSRLSLGAYYGSVQTAFDREAFEEAARAMGLRVSWSKPISSDSNTIYFVRLSYLESQPVTVKQFYFFGSSAEVEHKMWGLQFGLSLNFYPKN